MTHRPTPDPAQQPGDASSGQPPNPAAPGSSPDPGNRSGQPTAQGLGRVGDRYPVDLWPDYAQPAAPTPTAQPLPAQGSARGSAGLSVVALVLGLVGLVAPFLPFSQLIDRFPVRQYLAFPLALPALVLAVVTLAGDRRGKPAAAIAMMISLLALGVGLVMVYNYDLR